MSQLLVGKSQFGNHRILICTEQSISNEPKEREGSNNKPARRRLSPGSERSRAEPSLSVIPPVCAGAAAAAAV
jgi:hypothetical protein